MLESLGRTMFAARTAARPPVQAGGGGDAAPGMARDSLSLSGTSSAPQLSAGQAKIYQALPAAQRATFDRIYQVASRSAQLDLGKLLEDGRLFGSKDHEGQPLAASLSRVATGSLAPGLERIGLLGSLIKQVANPGSISQGGRGTCTVTTVEYMVAAQRPAEYARLVAGLSSSGGSVKLANGATVNRLADSTATDNSGRTDPSRLFEAAMMDYGNGVLSYSNQTDKNGVGSLSFLPGGLGNGAVAKVVSGVFGERWRSDDAVPVIGAIPYSSLGASRLMRDLQVALAKGESVPAGLDWRSAGEWKPAGHEVLVTKVEAGRVYFRNPWGSYDVVGAEPAGSGPRRRIEDNSGLESMPTAAFQKILQGLVVR